MDIKKEDGLLQRRPSSGRGGPLYLVNCETNFQAFSQLC